MNPDELTSVELADALQRHPGLTASALAARQLVVGHRYWLRRLEFRAALEVEVICGLIYASINWASAAVLVDELDAPESARAVLRLAVLLAGSPAGSDDPWSPWALRSILAGLDEHTPLGLTAITTAATAGRL